MEPMSTERGTAPGATRGTEPETHPGWPEVGESLRGGTRTITESDLVGFAAQTGDWHPQHVDADWAARGQFGGRVAHGMAILSYSVGLINFDPDRVVALRSLDSVRFKRPVRIGETISVEATVREVRAVDPPLALVGFGWTIRNQSGAAAIKARVDVLWRGDDPQTAARAAVGGVDESQAGSGSDDFMLYPGGLLL